MSVQQIARVLHVLPLLPARIADGRFRILVYLADAANEHGHNVFIGVRRLQALTRFNRRTIELAYKDFQAWGWLVREGRGRYRLTLPDRPVENLSISCTKPVESGATERSYDRSTTDPTIAKSDPTIAILAASPTRHWSSPPDPSSTRQYVPVREESGAVAPPPHPNPTRPSPEAVATLQHIKTVLLRARVEPLGRRARRAP